MRPVVRGDAVLELTVHRVQVIELVAQRRPGVLRADRIAVAETLLQLDRAGIVTIRPLVALDGEGAAEMRIRAQQVQARLIVALFSVLPGSSPLNGFGNVADSEVSSAASRDRDVDRNCDRQSVD